MKKIFLDSSCIIAAFHSRHEKHSQCLSLFHEVLKKRSRGFLAAHSLAEVFSVLTRLPGTNRVPPEAAAELIEANINGLFTIVSLTGEDYAEIIRRFSENNLGGGLVYDGLVIKAAEKAKVQILYTLNSKHFRTIPSSVSSRISEV